MKRLKTILSTWICACGKANPDDWKSCPTCGWAK